MMEIPPNPTIFLSLPIFHLDLEGKVSYWNDACALTSSIPAEEVLGTDEHWRAFYQRPRPMLADLLLRKEYADIHRRYCNLSKTTGCLHTYSGLMHIEHSVAGGSAIWTQGGYLYDEDNAVSGAYQIFQCVDPSNLSEYSSILKTLIHRFPIPAVLVVNHRLHVVNRHYARMLGHESPEEVEGLPSDHFIHESDKERFQELNSNMHGGIVEGESYCWRYIIRGETRHIEGHPVVFPWIQGNALFSTLIDATDRIRREDHLTREAARLAAENAMLENRLDRQCSVFIGKSMLMRKTLLKAMQVAASDTSVVILGETGTGKTLLANFIHENSKQAAHPFIQVNCAAIPEHLLESEFFGYRKGAFTGAGTDKQGFLGAANNGTLFLDEVGELSLSMQAKLLQAVETQAYTPLGCNTPRQVRVRLICATNRDLVKMVEQGKLREDFFYRIFVIAIKIPPLRERREDIPQLVSFILKKISPMEGGQALSGEVLASLMRYDWPGNMRELQNVVLRYVITGSPDSLDAAFHKTGDGPERPDAHPEMLPLEQAARLWKRDYFRRAIEASGGNKAAAARLLGVNLRTFHRQCATLGLTRGTGARHTP